MKKKVATGFFFCIFLWNCTHRNDVTDQISEIAPIKIDSANLSQDTITVGSAVSIRTYSTMQQGCESFYSYTYSAEGFNRHITANRLKTKTTCGSGKAVTSSFSLVPPAPGVYTLKFRSSLSSDAWLVKKMVVK